MSEKLRTVKVKEDTYADLSTIKGMLMARNHESKSYDDAIKELIGLYEKEEVGSEFPDFVHVNVFNDHATIADQKIKRFVEVFFRDDGTAFCEICESTKCDHVQYAYNLPEVKEAFKRKGLEIPSIKS